MEMISSEGLDVNKANEKEKYSQTFCFKGVLY